ncbi:DUF4365 domain-containing protein [Hymenobacter sp. GOD-10R]|uniref:DUF4365 domain-containing protein n=1 Tax=Hymenobacter sp. GOD-10R TaxID=3093922 RepID=UPI002D7948BD|nr:DUF4365 domain-containing protein [Hymenobacter sp. GOD-10R]WRQ28777.1 DUF4365 domain-containing protein [Hymenobacter sp. GOD-10R]
MTEQQIKEHLSKRYVELIASRSGFKKLGGENDHGVDLVYTRAKPRFINGEVRYCDTGEYVDLQLKCTCESSVEEKNGFIIYDLESKTFNDLVERVNNYPFAPLYLILMVLPDDQNKWLEVRKHEIALAKCAYWFQPQAGEKYTNNKKQVRIKIPIINIVDSIFLIKAFSLL